VQLLVLGITHDLISILLFNVSERNQEVLGSSWDKFPPHDQTHKSCTGLKDWFVPGIGDDGIAVYFEIVVIIVIMMVVVVVVITNEPSVTNKFIPATHN
jgi:hypothetical protein